MWPSKAICWSKLGSGTNNDAWVVCPPLSEDRSAALEEEGFNESSKPGKLTGARVDGTLDRLLLSLPRLRPEPGAARVGIRHS